ncbi:dihydropteroate synthase [Geothrix limicola]|uniref:dihydropteroate synthase n=1 Tax=Geothrix limicola TaxID=2927978 RepID=A0ABQ5QE72_9BACT|nr:dihydropteroate synthase [Geothrix limicola]GLH72440.1 dihydropteroate synthase [Geothrix limicola]
MNKAAFDWGPLLKGGPLFIGILNLTPDSFSDGGRFMDPRAALGQAQALIQAGARMLDLGAESTRPGAAPVDAAEEWRRLKPVIQGLRKAFPDTPLSLDTRHAEVAKVGLGAGVAVLNDVTGFSDPRMLDLAQASTCGLIAMRSRREGPGFHMPPYEDPAPRDAKAALEEMRAVRDRLLKAAIDAARVLLDPGFGFGTTFLEDLALWGSLPGLPKALDWPAERVCIGISRKRFLAARAGTPGLPPAQRDGLSAAAHAEALSWGYRVFRTHAIG